MAFLYGLEAESYDRTFSNRELIGRISAYFRPRRAIILLVVVLVVVGAITEALAPILIARGIDTFVDSITLAGVVGLSGLILLAGVLSWVFNYIRQRYLARAIADVVFHVQRDACAAILSQDLAFFDANPSGKTISRVTSDAEEFSTIVVLIVNLISQMLLIVIIVGALFSINARLAALAVAIAPVLFVVTLGFRWVARSTSQRTQRALARVNASVEETISGITISKNFRQEQAVYTAFQQVNLQAYLVGLRQGMVFGSIMPILSSVTGIGTLVMIYFGGQYALSGAISVGAWLLFVQSIGLFWSPLTNIAAFWSLFQQGLVASERIFALIDARPRLRQHGHEPVRRLAGRIEFKQVNFRYTSQETVLQDFDFGIEPGQMVALVGHTGAGKSSLGRLVARFYEFQEGQLLIDDRDIRSLELSSYRRQLAIVPQTPFLFSGTVADNIRFARPDATDEEVWKASRQIGGGAWLETFPEGLSTLVGEGGRSVSLGQRQLIALSRVLLQDPSIIILDEATASIDPLTEVQVQEGLRASVKGRTSIVIAHRLSTIKQADRIIVLDRGRIVEDGTHDALIARAGYYASLYNTYFRHQSPNYRPGEGFVPARS